MPFPNRAMTDLIVHLIEHPTFKRRLAQTTTIIRKIRKRKSK